MHNRAGQVTVRLMAFEELKDLVWVQARLKEGLVNADIARLLGCSPVLVCKALKALGVSSPRSELLKKLNDQGLLGRLYVTENRNAAQVARLLGCDRSAVHAALRRFGFEIKDRSEAQVVKTEHLGSSVPRPKTRYLNTLNNKAWLEARLAEGLSVTRIAKQAHCAALSVSDALARFGLEPNLPALRTPHVLPENYRTRRLRNPDSRHRFWFRARRIVPPGPCVVCGRTGLDVNHIDRNPENNDPSNLERLCRRCHRRQEGTELMVMQHRLEGLGVPFREIHAEARLILKRSLT